MAAARPRYGFWLALALPALGLIAHGLLIRHGVDYLRWTGEISCILLIITLAVTPLQMMFGPLPWLKARRRNIGVASFLYGALHLAVWLASTNMGRFLNSFSRPDVLAGWLALAVMLALALTSTDAAVRKMGPRWKALQRWIYAAAILSLVHWMMLTGFALRVWIYVLPILLLQGWRIMRRQGRMRRA